MAQVFFGFDFAQPSFFGFDFAQPAKRLKLETRKKGDGFESVPPFFYFDQKFIQLLAVSDD